ncbi:unnamed protein product [Alopecurus aequalis]
MKKLRLPVAKGSRTESHWIIDGGGTSPTIVHAAQSVTVVLTVAVDDGRLSRSVAIRWHRAHEKTGSGTASADGVEDVTTTLPRGHTITYNFVAEHAGTFTYRARYGRDRAASRIDVRAPGSEGGHAGLSVSRLPRAAAGHGVANVPATDSRARVGRPVTAGTAVRRADGRGSRGMGSVVAQIMGDCPVIYYNDAEYDGGPPVQRLLRWSVATLTAAALWVSGLCGPRDQDVRRRHPQLSTTLS